MDLNTKLDELTPKQFAYVTYRTLTESDAAAYRKAGYSRSAWYRLPQERRDLMNGCALELSKETKLDAIELITQEMIGAAQRLIELAKTAKNEGVRLKANREILGLGGLVITKSLDVTTGGDEITVTYVNTYAEDEDG